MERCCTLGCSTPCNPVSLPPSSMLLQCVPEEPQASAASGQEAAEQGPAAAAQAERDSLQAAVQRHGVQLAQAGQELAAAHAERDSLQAAVQQRDAQLAHAGQEPAEAQAERDSLQAAVHQHDEQLAQGGQQLAAARAERDSLQAAMHQRDEQLAQARQELTATHAECGSLQEALQQREKQLAAERQQCEELQAAVGRLQQQVAALQQEAERATTAHQAQLERAAAAHAADRERAAAAHAAELVRQVQRASALEQQLEDAQHAQRAQQAPQQWGGRTGPQLVEQVRGLELEVQQLRDEGQRLRAELEAAEHRRVAAAAKARAQQDSLAEQRDNALEAARRARAAEEQLREALAAAQRGAAAGGTAPRRRGAGGGSSSSGAAAEGRARRRKQAGGAGEAERPQCGSFDQGAVACLPPLSRPAGAARATGAARLRARWWQGISGLGPGASAWLPSAPLEEVGGSYARQAYQTSAATPPAVSPGAPPASESPLMPVVGGPHAAEIRTAIESLGEVGSWQPDWPCAWRVFYNVLLPVYGQRPPPLSIHLIPFPCSLSTLPTCHSPTTVAGEQRGAGRGARLGAQDAGRPGASPAPAAGGRGGGAAPDAGRGQAAVLGGGSRVRFFYLCQARVSWPAAPAGACLCCMLPVKVCARCLECAGPVSLWDHLRTATQPDTVQCMLCCDSPSLLGNLIDEQTVAVLI